MRKLRQRVLRQSMIAKLAGNNRGKGITGIQDQLYADQGLAILDISYNALKRAQGMD